MSEAAALSALVAALFLTAYRVHRFRARRRQWLRYVRMVPVKVSPPVSVARPPTPTPAELASANP